MVEEAISFWTEIQRYEDMLAADPNSYCFVPLSDLYRKLGLLDDAISVAQKGAERHPDYAPGFFALGAAHNAKGEKERARGALERTVALKGDHVEALKLLGQLYVEAGDIERAKAVLGRALRQDPDDAEIELLLRSIAPGEAMPQPEEEIIEDVEVIEELEELEEEGTPSVAPEVAATVAQGRPLTELAMGQAPGKGEPAALEEPSDFWASGIPAQAQDEPEDEEFSGFDASDEPETAAVEPSGVRGAAAESGRRDPLSTATLAELYVSQGHIAKALGIYQQLLAEDPGNHSYRQRVFDLKKLAEQQPAPQEEAAPQPPVKEAPVKEPPVEKPPVKEPPVEKAPVRAQAEPVQEEPGPEAFAAGMGPEAQLTDWLEKIRRRRDGV